MRVILFIFLILSASTGFSQLTKGNFLAGGSISFQSVNHTFEDDNSLNIQAMPGGGYFFIDKLAAGLKISYLHSKDDNDSYREFLAGPFARYYFLNDSKKINVFLEADYLLGNEKYKGFDPEGLNSFGFAVGPAFFLNQHVAIESVLNWRSLKYNGDPGRYNSLGLAIGFQVHLQCKKPVKANQ